MKIKTITCHNVYNHGAILQEFALLKYLEMEGHEAETINYQPAYLADNYKLFTVPSQKWKSNFIKKAIYIILKMPGRLKDLKRYKLFDEFSQHYIQETKKIYKTNDEIIDDLPLADAYICGSDQVWNSLFQNGKDPSFYLDFAPSNKLKISYAASFAIDKLDEKIKPFVKAKVKKIDHISVRESSGIKILKDLGINDVTQVLDPVFLLDSDYWNETFVNKIECKYILVYDFDTNKVIKDIALKTAKENEFKIFALNKNIKYADKIFWQCGPKMFLSLIANAELILSTSFHAVAFSIIFKKKFYVFNRKENINTRMKDLMTLVNLDNRLISEMNEFNFEENIDYLTVLKKTHEYREVSKRFLKNSLLEKTKNG